MGLSLQVSNPQSQTFAGKKVSFATPQDATSFPLFAAQASLRIEYPEPSLPCPSYALAKSCLVLVTYMGPDGWCYSEIMRRILSASDLRHSNPNPTAGSLLAHSMQCTIPCPNCVVFLAWKKLSLLLISSTRIIE